MQRMLGTDDTRPERARGESEMEPDAGNTGHLLLLLRVAGVRQAEITRLKALRRVWRDRDPALDGFVPDHRASFARWLYERGRIGG
jgi:hypothetical protein